MPSNDDKSFSELTHQLFRQYAEFNGIIDSMNGGAVDEITGIAEQMRQIKLTEAKLLPLRNEFIQLKQRLPNELQAVTDKTVEIIKELMPKLAQLEKATVESSKRLIPEVKQSVRAVQMQSAYGGGRR